MCVKFSIIITLKKKLLVRRLVTLHAGERYVSFNLEITRAGFTIALGNHIKQQLGTCWKRVKDSRRDRKIHYQGLINLTYAHSLGPISSCSR